MKQIKLFALTCASVFLLCVTGCEQDLEAPKKTANDVVPTENAVTPYGSSRFLIIASSTSLPSDMAEQVTKAGGKVLKSMPGAGIVIAQSDDKGFAKKASKINGVRSVVPDIKIQWIAPRENVSLDEAYGNPSNSGDDDERFDLQWGHDAVDAPEAWNLGYRGEGARVAILDTGFDLDHPDLEDNIDFDASENFVEDETLQYSLDDPFSHGTHVAGTIAAADNGEGTIGIAPEATLILVKVLSDEGSGDFADIIAGIVHAADAGADVINMSLGLYLFKNGGVLAPDGSIITIPARDVAALKNALQKVINYAYQHGVTVIASAGNDAINGQADKSGVHVPSDLAHVISISATAPIGWAADPVNADFDRLASYSNYGNKVDFAAPGGDVAYPGEEACTVAGITRPCWVFDLVYSTGNDGWYWSAGTSMASPHAAGVAAIIIGANGGDMHPAQVEAKMKKSAEDIYKPGRDLYSGHGQVNAYNAVADGV